MTSQRNHVVISGTGRTGTTFLMHLLTKLGLETGYTPETVELPLAARAGLENNILESDAPYIVKSPYLCDQIEAVVAANVKIDAAIVPVRRFEAAAASRAHVQKLTTGEADGETVVGGLWDTTKANQQVDVLRIKFTNLIEGLVRYDIPIIFLAYPRLVRDPDYAYGKLQFLLGDIDLATFRAAFDDIVRPDWVHQFTSDDL